MVSGVGKLENAGQSRISLAKAAAAYAAALHSVNARGEGSRGGRDADYCPRKSPFFPGQALVKRRVNRGRGSLAPHRRGARGSVLALAEGIHGTQP